MILVCDIHLEVTGGSSVANYSVLMIRYSVPHSWQLTLATYKTATKMQKVSLECVSHFKTFTFND